MKPNIKTLNSQGVTFDVKSDSRPISDYEGYSIPILYLSGSLAGMTKDNAVSVSYIYKERSGTCTLKWQGASSLNLSKKNYTIKFDNEFEVVSGWGAQKKYVLKANWVDSSHARNIVCAKLWGQIVKSRTPANAALNALPNGGAIDGFPILLAFNGKFMGLYTWNIPKDGWMFGMSGTAQQQAIVCAENNNNGAVAFKGLATLTEDADGQLDFDLEYSSNDESDWVLASLNRLLSAVKDSDGTNITYGITPYLDWESAIDYYIHGVLTGNYDGLFRNYLLVTYDGVKWFFTGYDMDVVLGLRAMGKYFYPANHESMSFTTMAAHHKVFELIWKYMRPQLRERYNQLRAAAMSVENVANMFVDFVADIPLPVYMDDIRLWNDIPASGSNNLSQIITYYDMRCRNADEWIKSTSGETALPEQVDPSVFSVTNTLSNCKTSNSTATIQKNATYTATITANSGYELSSVVVVMGGADITSTAYSGGKINIASVTGDIVITATATEIVVPGYTNQVPISVDTDGKTIFNGTGWIGNKRLSSSGAVKDSTYTSVTGYIPASSGDIIRIKGVTWTGSSNYVCSYDANHGFLTAINGQGAYGGGTLTRDDDVSIVTLPINANIRWIRVSAIHDDRDAGYAGVADKLEGPGSYLIVTVNEEITD